MNNLKNLIKITFASLALSSILSGTTLANPNKIEIEKIYLTSCINGGVCSTTPKEVLLGDDVKLNLVVEAKKNNKQVYFSDKTDLELNGERIDFDLIKSWEEGDVKINWYKIESRFSSYNNVGGKYFRWDTPSYLETLVKEGDEWEIKADGHPTNLLSDVNNGLGTMRYKAEFIYKDFKISTPGKESSDIQGIKNNVHRVSFRKDNNFLGWLTSFFNVPYVYGSAGRQIDAYVGADCADFVVGAYKKASGRDVPYTYAAGLTNFADRIIKQEEIFTDGKNFYKGNELLRYGKDVKEGDLILYGGWHVGVLFEDRSNPFGEYSGDADGILDNYDLIINTFFDFPKKESIEKYGEFSILRWK